MKLFKSLLLVACAALSFAACDKDDDKTPVNPTPKGYVGELSVDQTDGTFFKQQGVSVRYDLKDDRTVDIYMYRVQFAEAMPVKLDMTIPGVECKSVGERIELSGERIIPLAMGGEFPRYTITSLRGTLTDSELQLSMNCGEFPVGPCSRTVRRELSPAAFRFIALRIFFAEFSYLYTLFSRVELCAILQR